MVEVGKEMSQGVVYLLCGMGAAERLAVSIFTLREHWDGSITMLTCTDEETSLAREIANDLSCHVLQIDAFGKDAMLNKVLIPEHTPYEETLFIDADTIVVGSMDEMFGAPLTLTRYARWQSNKRFSAKWIRRWKTHLLGLINDVDVQNYLDMVDVQLENPYPTINTGVFAFRRSNANLVAWKNLAHLHPNAWAVDQIAMQILTSAIPHRVMDDRFNNSVVHGHETMDLRLIHFHGRKHCGGRERSCEWKDAFSRAFEADAGGLKGWAGKHDKRVREWMGGNR